MKLAKELIKLISEHYASNNLKLKIETPANEEYMELLKTTLIIQYLKPYGYTSDTKLSKNNYPIKALPESIASMVNLIEKGSVLLYLTDDEEPYGYISNNIIEGFDMYPIPPDFLTRIDLVTKGSIFLYLNEILSWNEVKVLLNIGDENNGVLLFKNLPTDSLGSYDIIISLLAVLFGKVSYDVETIPTYNFERLTNDVYYGNQPYYYYGYKAALSYNNLDDLLDNIDWFISNHDETLNRYDVLGMLRINNKFAQSIIEANELESNDIETELDNLGLYNVALNLIRIDETTLGLNNILFDFYKAVTEITRFSPDGKVFEQIDGMTVRSYSKYVDTVAQLDATYANVEKIGNIIRDIQNFLIH